MIRRSMPVSLRNTEDGTIELSASSEYPVKRGMYTEILDHGANAVQNIAAAALFNHDPNQVIGTIRSSGIGSDRRLRATIELLPDARLPSGVAASEAVRSGALTGVSIGYSIDDYQETENNGRMIIRATRWTLREISLTPVPADHTVGIGRLESSDDAEFAAAIAQRSTSEKNNRQTPEKDAAVTEVNTTTTTPPLAVMRKEAIQIAQHAESLGLRAADYLDQPIAAAREKMLADLATARGATQAVPGLRAVVTLDAVDKLVRGTAQDLVEGGGNAAIHRFARATGHDLEASGGAIADWAMRNLRGNLIDMKQVREWKRAGRASLDGVRAAEVTANFTMVAGLAATKLAFDGFTAYKPWSDAVLSKGKARDFKTIRTGSLQMGDFSSPAEGSPFSDLVIDDAGGTGSLVMRGAGIELTKQALYNDELDLFLSRIRKVGYLAAQHQDKLAATAIPGATWTAATAALALSAANLKTAWLNFMAITGPAGEKPGYVPRKLLVPSSLAILASELTAISPGATTENPLASNSASLGKMPLEVVHGLHLTDANDWFILADPMDASGFTYFTHPDYELPQLFEVDPGLVASRKFRIEYPTAIIVSHLNPGTNTKPVGAYQATQP